MRLHSAQPQQPTDAGTPSAPEPRPEGKELHKIGLLPLLALFYAYTTSGPFGYEDIYAVSGPGMALVFLALVPFAWSIPMSLASAEMNSMLPVEGGFYRWVRAAFGDFWGFQCGWWNWTGTFLLNAAYGVLFMDYLATYLPNLPWYWRFLGASLFLCAVALLNVRGIRMAGSAAMLLQTLVLVPVAWLCLAALLHWRHNPLLPFVPPGKPLASVFGAGLALAMWNYAGYEQLSSVAGEIKNPRKTFLRALAWNTPLAILTYTLPGTLALAALGNWGAWHSGYLATAAGNIGGPVLGLLMWIAAIIGTAALSDSTILSTTRIPLAMAEDGYLSPRIARLHARFGTPVAAIAFSTAIYCALTIKTTLVSLIAIYIWARIATTLLTLLAAWRLRHLMPHALRTFRIPGGRLGLACVIVLPVLLCGVGLYNSDPVALRYGPWLIASGPLAYLVLRRFFHLRASPSPARDLRGNS